MRIPPKFTITKNIWILLNSIEEKTRILDKTRLPEIKWQRLVSENLLKSSLFSAKVEGNPLELKDTSHLSTKKREHLEVRNLIRALKYISKNIHFNQKITERFICRLHAIAMGKIDEEAGLLRTKQNAIYNQYGFVVYMPPPPDEAKLLLAKLINFIQSPKYNAFPLVKAMIVHYVFEKIHPFIDGNGRVGRLLIYAILKICGSDKLKTISFEEKLNEEKEDYYYYLSKENEVCGFVEFMLNIINESLGDAMSKLLSYSNSEGAQTLLPRREEILNIIKEHKYLSVDFLHRRFQNVSDRTIRNDLKDLIERGLVVKGGETKGAVYKLKITN